MTESRRSRGREEATTPYEAKWMLVDLQPFRKPSPGSTHGEAGRLRTLQEHLVPRKGVPHPSQRRQGAHASSWLSRAIREGNPFATTLHQEKGCWGVKDVQAENRLIALRREAAPAAATLPLPVLPDSGLGARRSISKLLSIDNLTFDGSPGVPVVLVRPEQSGAPGAPDGKRQRSVSSVDGSSSQLANAETTTTTETTTETTTTTAMPAPHIVGGITTAAMHADAQGGTPAPRSRPAPLGPAERLDPTRGINTKHLQPWEVSVRDHIKTAAERAEVAAAEAQKVATEALKLDARLRQEIVAHSTTKVCYCR